MSQRTVRSLIESRELKARSNALGGLSYVLHAPGAAALEVRGIAGHMASTWRPVAPRSGTPH